MTERTVALAHKTWLAGAGACDNGREQAVSKFDQLFVNGSAFVNDLLEKGELLETQIQAKLEARKMLKDKISALFSLRSKLGFGNANRDQQIDKLSQRVDSLIDVVSKLAEQKAAEQKAAEQKAAEQKATENKTPTAVSTTKKAPTKSAASKTVPKTLAKTAVKSVAKASATKAPARAPSKAPSKAPTRNTVDKLKAATKD